LGLGITVAALQLPTSSLESTRWKLRLDVGLQPGTWMPKRFPGWGESGARLALDVDVEFSGGSSPSQESLVGPKDMTYVLNVCGGTSKFVSEAGEQQVTFVGGGWCIQRPKNNIRNSEGGAVRPEGLLCFWLDCPSGATRRDVKIFPDTRIFFTTGIWDDPAVLGLREEEYKEAVAELQTLVDRTRDYKSEENLNIIDEARKYRQLVADAKEFERLKQRKEQLEREAPPAQASQASNGVQIAPTGSLVIKGNKIPDWFPGSEYLILGTFSTKAPSELYKTQA